MKKVAVIVALAIVGALLLSSTVAAEEVATQRRHHVAHKHHKQHHAQQDDADMVDAPSVNDYVPADSTASKYDAPDTQEEEQEPNYRFEGVGARDRMRKRTLFFRRLARRVWRGVKRVGRFVHRVVRRVWRFGRRLVRRAVRVGGRVVRRVVRVAARVAGAAVGVGGAVVAGAGIGGAAGGLLKGRKRRPEDIEDCVACRYVWLQVEQDVGNSQIEENIYDSFTSSCIEAQKAPIFFPACSAMFNDIYGMIGDYMDGYTVNQVCEAAKLCR